MGTPTALQPAPPSAALLLLLLLLELLLLLLLLARLPPPLLLAWLPHEQPTRGWLLHAVLLLLGPLLA